MSKLTLSWDQLHTTLRQLEKTPYGVANSDDPVYPAVSLAAVAIDGHSRNVEAGWWSDLKTGKRKERNVGELLMLCVSELAEVPTYPDADRLMDDKLPHRLMFHCEVADCLIRLFDIIGGLDVDVHGCYALATHSVYTTHLRHAREDQLYELDWLLMVVVRHLAGAMEGHRKAKVLPTGMKQFDVDICLAVAMLFHIARMTDIPLADVIVEKMKFNAVRQDHKIESRMADDGKKY